MYSNYTLLSVFAKRGKLYQFSASSFFLSSEHQSCEINWSVVLTTSNSDLLNFALLLLYVNSN